MDSQITIKGHFYFGGLRHVALVFLFGGLFIWIYPFFKPSAPSVLQTALTGAFAILVAAIIWFSRYGYQFNFGEKIYREYFFILGFKIGAWQSLRKLSVLVLTLRDRSALKSPGLIAPANSKDDPVYEISLQSEGLNRYQIVLESKSETIRLLELLNKNLQLKVVKGTASTAL